MDKNTRILLLYSKLMQGEKINKVNFCMETDCLSRTFERDIKDIRLYLNESYSANELKYNRMDNTYYFSDAFCKPLESTEYLLVEQLLMDTRVLRSDEMDGLLKHLALNTENSRRLKNHQLEAIKAYNEPFHQRPILKMLRDLKIIIQNKSVITIKYIKQNGDNHVKTIIPCLIRYDSGYLYLIAYQDNYEKKYPSYYRIDRIYEFAICRRQTLQEIQRNIMYIMKYSAGITQMFGGEFCEVTISCKKNYYQYVFDKFQDVKIIEERCDTLILKFSVFEKGFIKWILGQPTEFVTVLYPESMKEAIKKSAKEIINNYVEVE